VTAPAGAGSRGSAPAADRGCTGRHSWRSCTGVSSASPFTRTKGPVLNHECNPALPRLKAGVREKWEIF
jgi:hypothetical protein